MGDITVHMVNSDVTGPAYQYWKVKGSLVLALSVSYLATNPAYSGEWQFIPRIEVAESYDDNIRLAEEGKEQSDYVTEVSPGFSFNGKGKRASLALDYRMQNIYYQKNSDSDDTYHNFSMNSNVEFIREKLFLDASATYTQREVNDDSASSFDNASITDNRSDVVTYTVRPYYIQTFSQSAVMRIEHTYQEIDNKNDELSNADTITNTSVFNLRSGPSFDTFRWQITHREQVTDYEDNPDIEHRDSKLDTQYHLGKTFYLIAIYGYEKFNYDVAPGKHKPEGEYWEAGIGWIPSLRTSLEMTGGEHYYGNTKRFNFSHRTRLTTWSARYSETVSTTSRLNAETDAVRVYNPDTADFDVYERENFSNVAAVTLNKIFEASVSKKTGKSDYSARYSNIKSENLDIVGNQENSSLSLNWRWKFASRTRMDLASIQTKTEVQPAQIETTSKRNEIKFTLDHSRKASSFLSYSNDSQQARDDRMLYRRNIYKIGFRMSF